MTENEKIKQIENQLDELKQKTSTMHERIKEIQDQLKECEKIQNIDLNSTSYLRRKEYAKKYRMTERTLDRYIKAGRVSATKFYGIILIQDEPPRE